MLIRIAATALSLGMVVSCQGSPSAPARGPQTDLGDVRLSAAEIQRLATADTAFAGRLFGQVAEDAPGNVVMSPASVAIALEMAYAGARGDTAREMAEVLQVPDVKPLQVAAAAARLRASLADLADDPDELLSLVNTVWVQSGFPLTPTYDSAMRTGFGAGMRRIDLGGDPEGARATINDDVARSTHDKIRDLLPPGSITDLTRLVLANAVYLHAAWASPFDRADTQPRAFHLADGSIDYPTTMEQTASLPYVDGDGYQAVELPYAGGRLAMSVLVPDHGLGPLQRRVARSGPAALVADAKPTKLTLDLPSFRFTWERELSGALGSLGMPTAFGGDADFSGISTAEQLQIGVVQHKAFIALDEKGTEAAAATAIGVVGTAAHVAVTHDKLLRVDRPFLFAISDRETGLPLFLGRVTDPGSTVDG